MTLEGHGAAGEETPAPPALTRWSDEEVEEEADLLPPYVPGGGRSRAPAAGSAAGGRGTAGEDDRTPIEETPAAPTAEPEPAEPVDNAFPFEMPAAPAPEPADDFPFHAFDLGAREAEAAEPLERGAEREREAEPEREADALAERLDRLAEALRRDGRAAVERELSGGDRVTALLAGVLAGYLAGLED